jgi:putative transposase
MMVVHLSGHYAWRVTPVSARQRENQRLLGLIKQSWLENGGVYGYRKITDDLRDLGERCGKHRVYRLMRQEGLHSHTGYRRRRGQRYGQSSVAAPNRVQQQFDVTEPNRVWVTDITYILTHEGSLYLSVVLDLFSRQVIGWSIQSRMESELAISALAVWRRQPKHEAIVHSDQGSQFSSCHWQHFLQAHTWSLARADAAIVMTMPLPRASSSCSSGSGYAEGSMPTASKLGVTCSIISKCFIIRPGDMVTTITCLQ